MGFMNKFKGFMGIPEDEYDDDEDLDYDKDFDDDLDEEDVRRPPPSRYRCRSRNR